MLFFDKISKWSLNNLIVYKGRAESLVRKHYKGQHQLTSVTSNDRYPELFSEAVRLAGTKPNLKLLSFGCSTGEECYSLRKYFPQAKIVGVDINESNLKKASKQNQDEGIYFLMSTPHVIKNEGPYDLIFCLSVLCRWDDTRGLQNCEKVYPFEKYKVTVELLANQLNKNGLLVIYNSNFRFEDTRVSSDFEIVDTPTIENSGFVNKFNATNDAVLEPHRYCVYRKK
jgi:chemotaxis methyl-accepting protein methylase